jgi:ABC-type glycerol-3-phosphate transport system substrate-binding protein
MGRFGCFAILASALSACGGESSAPSTPDAGPSSPQGAVTIIFLEQENPAYHMANQAVFEAYQTAHPNVTIQVTTLDYRTLTASFLSDLKNDRLNADLIQMTPNWQCSFADNLADVPADVLTLSDAKRIFLAPPIDSVTCDGTLKGIPLEYSLDYGGVVANIDKFEARFPGKQPGWLDWRAFIADGAALVEYDTDGTPRTNGLDIDPNFAGATEHLLLASILQRGGQYWAPDGNSFDLTTPEAHDALTDIVSWIVNDKVMSLSLIPAQGFVGDRLAHGTTGYGWNDPLRPLSAMGYIGSWALGYVQQNVPPERATTRYGYFATPPIVGTEHRFASYGGWAFAVPKTSKNQRVAWDIARSLALDPVAMKRWSATATTLPALRVNASEEAAATDPILAQVQPLLEGGQYIGFIPAEAIQIMEGAIVSNVFAVVRGSKTVDMALADMESSINMAIAQYK